MPTDRFTCVFCGHRAAYEYDLMDWVSSYYDPGSEDVESGWVCPDCVAAHMDIDEGRAVLKDGTPRLDAPWLCSYCGSELVRIDTVQGGDCETHHQCSVCGIRHYTGGQVE